MSLLLETAFKASCVLAAAAIANLLLHRRTSAASRHLLWTLAVAGLLVLPILSASLPRWEVEIPVATPNVAVAAPVRAAIGRADMASAASAAPPVAARTAATPADVEGAGTPPIGRRMAWAALFAAVYAAGVLLLLIRLVHQQWMVRRLARRATEVSDPDWTRLRSDCAIQIGVQRPVRVLRSLDRSMPMAFGIRQPSILVPSVADTWSEDRRRAVLLHELAHIARRDCLTQLMTATACAVYWIHPGVWWVARRLRVERELACDDRVLRAGAHAREYAEHLLELAYTLGGYRAPALVVAMARPRQIEGRMLAVLDAARNRAVPALRGRLTGAAIATALLVPLAAAQASGVSAKAGTGERVTKPGAGIQDAPEVTAIAEKGVPGTWEIRATQTAPVVHLRLSESASTSHGFAISRDRLLGLAPSRLSGADGPAAFAVRRDAGTFAFEGRFNSGVGAGTYTFAPNAGFPDELVRRGFARPTGADQYLFARHDIGFAFLDELTAQKYARPDLAQLVRAAQHGVGLSFVREMGALGYRLGQVDALIAQRDHGVSPAFIRDLGVQGLTGLTAGDLIRARNHGVSPEYLGELRALGHTQLSLDALVGARDHGISAEYVRDLRELGYPLTLTELATAREHGVSAEYIRDLTALGYPRMTLGALIAARNHGISPEYVRELRELGYRLTIDELTRARDHGVSAEYVRQFRAQGRDRLTLDELVAMRDWGTTPARGQVLHESKLTFYAVYHVHAVHQWIREFVDRWIR